MCACLVDRYRRHIHQNCSPHTEFFDDDEFFSKESNTEVKKITHQIHVRVEYKTTSRTLGIFFTQAIVSEMQSHQQRNAEVSGQELAAVSGVFADYTDHQDEKLTQIEKQLGELKKSLSKEEGWWSI